MFFSSPRAQAALEYLMTYGWSLVLIVTVASVLFILISPDPASFRCASSDAGKIPLKNYNVPNGASHVFGVKFDYWYTVNDPQSKMVLQNATGGPISVTKVECAAPDGTFGSCSDGARCCYLTGCDGATKLNGVLLDTVSSAVPVVVRGGQEFSITDPEVVYKVNLATWGCADTLKPPGKYRLSYNNQFGYPRTVEITCNGLPGALRGTYT